MGQNVQTYGITIEHVWEHGKILSFPGPGNLKVSLNWKHDAESTFLSHDLGQIAKNTFNKQKAKNTVKPSGQKAVGFRHFAKREFETNEICSHALKPTSRCSIFKIQSSDQGPDAFPHWSSGISKCVFPGQAEGQEMPKIIIVKLKSKTPLSLSIILIFLTAWKGS